MVHPLSLSFCTNHVLVFSFHKKKLKMKKWKFKLSDTSFITFYLHISPSSSSLSPIIRIYHHHISVIIFTIYIVTKRILHSFLVHTLHPIFVISICIFIIIVVPDSFFFMPLFGLLSWNHKCKNAENAPFIPWLPFSRCFTYWQ